MFQAKKSTAPPLQIARLRDQVRNVRLQRIASALSQQQTPAGVLGLSDADRAIVANLRTHNSVHIRN